MFKDDAPFFDPAVAEIWEPADAAVLPLLVGEPVVVVLAVPVTAGVLVDVRVVLVFVIVGEIPAGKVTFGGGRPNSPQMSSNSMRDS